MKKVLSIILCLLLVGCSSGKSEEEYINITNEFTYQGFTFYQYEKMLTLSLNLDGTDIGFFFVNDDKGDLPFYTFALSDEDISAQYNVSNDGNNAVISYGGLTLCAYNFDTESDDPNYETDGCDMSEKEFAYSVRDMHDQTLQELGLSQDDLKEWATWYIETHTATE